MATPEAATDPNLVSVMLDRPMAQVARFAGRVVTTWLRGLVDPLGLGEAAAARCDRLAPPFAFLVVMLFVSLVAARMSWALGLTYAGAGEVTRATVLEDLRIALGDVSLGEVTLVTLPAVLMVAFGGRLISVLGRGRDPLDRDPVVDASCYAVGWLAGCVVIATAGLFGLAASGFTESGGGTRFVNSVLPVLAGTGLVWGGLILGPAVRLRLPTRTPWPGLASTGLGVLAVGAIFVLGYRSLTWAADLSTAARRAIDRQMERYSGELQANVLAYEPSDRGAALTIAFSNRSKRVVIVPDQAGFSIPHTAKTGAVMSLPILASSIEALPDRALVIEPETTRVAVYETPAYDGPDRPYAVRFHRRHEDGSFTASEAVFWSAAFARDHLKAGRMRDSVVR